MSVIRSAATSLLLLVSMLCMAVPAARKKTMVTQPDGSPLAVYTAGDEFAHYHVTEDGIIIAPDPKGEWKYVPTVIDGVAMTGRITAHAPQFRTPAERLYVEGIDQQRLVSRLSASRRDMRPADLIATKGMAVPSKAPGRYSVTSFSPFGNVRGLIVLVDFPDRKFSLPDSLIQKKFSRMYNEEGYSDSDIFNGRKLKATGSVRDYFSAQSFGQFTPQFDIIGPITAKNGYAYYGSNGSTGKDDSRNAQKLVNEILEYLHYDSSIDLNTYDSDGNREIDFMGFIYAGNGENYVSDTDPDCIWPHQWEISKRLGSIQRVNYFMTCELLWDSKTVFDGIGIFCHEFSHALGLPDFYYSGGNAIGSWSIMDYGSYNNEGYTPAGYLAFERYSLSWMDLDPIISPGSYTIAPLQQGQAAFRLDTDNENQFIVLENIQDSGWNLYHPGSGLLVTAVSYDYGKWYENNPNSTLKKGFTVLPADGDIDYAAQKSDLFPYGTKDSITMYGYPALRIDKGPYINLAVRNISRKTNGQVTFTLDDYTTGITGAPGNSPEITVTPYGALLINAAAGTPVSISDTGGMTFRTFVSDGTETTVQLPERGIWIVRCGSKTEKVQY